MRPSDLLAHATRYLERHDVESPRATAEVLLQHVLGIDRAALYARAAEIKPDDYQCACLLAQMYLTLGREQESEEAAQKVQEEVSREFEEQERALELLRQEGETEELAAE